MEAGILDQNLDRVDLRLASHGEKNRSYPVQICKSTAGLKDRKPSTVMVRERHRGMVVIVNTIPTAAPKSPPDVGGPLLNQQWIDRKNSHHHQKRTPRPRRPARRKRPLHVHGKLVKRLYQPCRHRHQHPWLSLNRVYQERKEYHEYRLHRCISPSCRFMVVRQVNHFEHTRVHL